MASLQDCLRIPKINSQFIKRNSALMELNNAVANVKQLNKATPKVRQFLVMEKEIDGLMSRLKSENAIFTQALLSQNPDINSDSNFNSDQVSIRSKCFSSMEAVDDYRGLLEEKNLIRSATQDQDLMNQQQSVNDLLAKLSANLEVLTTIGKAQVEASKKQTDALVASKGPETKQPDFFTCR